MQIATWNVNGLRARLEFVLHWLRERQPDVVALQELKLTDEQFPHDAFAAAGYQALTHGQKSWNGVAILSRKPMQALTRGLPGQADFGARLITAEVDGLAFTSVYCPNGKTLEHADYPRKLDWFDSLAEHLEQTCSPDDPIAIGGDFNICPGPLDSWNEEVLAGEIFHTPQERGRFQRLLDWGLVDVFRELRPHDAVFSWWDYRGGAFHKGQGLRIDFLLTTRGVAARARGAEVDRDYRKKKDGLTASDHAPVIVELEST